MSNNYPETIEYLSKCIENNALANVYLFYGPDEEGKIDAAVFFAQNILKHSGSSFCPDLLSISPDENDHISIGQAREIRRFLSLSPVSLHKVVIISRAECLREESQNTILKVLEEAPSYATIIMLAKTLDSILPTVISRSIKIPFWKLKNQKQESDKKTVDILIKLIKGSIQDRYIIVDKILKDEPDAVKVFEKWLYFLRKLFLKKIKKEDTSLVDYSEKETVHLLSSVQNLYTRLSQTNVNPKYAYDELILLLK